MNKRKATINATFSWLFVVRHLVTRFCSLPFVFDEEFGCRACQHTWLIKLYFKQHRMMGYTIDEFNYLMQRFDILINKYVIGYYNTKKAIDKLRCCWFERPTATGF